MTDVNPGASIEGPSNRIAGVAWGLLLVWTGAVVLLHWGWGVGSFGAGAILLGAQAVRRHLRLAVDGFGLTAGALFVLSGATSLFQVTIDLFPIFCIVAGLAFLVSSWTTRTRPPTPARPDLQAPAHPRP